MSWQKVQSVGLLKFKLVRIMLNIGDLLMARCWIKSLACLLLLLHSDSIPLYCSILYRA